MCTARIARLLEYKFFLLARYFLRVCIIPIYPLIAPFTWRFCAPAQSCPFPGEAHPCTCNPRHEPPRQVSEKKLTTVLDWTEKATNSLHEMINEDLVSSD